MNHLACYEAGALAFGQTGALDSDGRDRDSERDGDGLELNG